MDTKRTYTTESDRETLRGAMLALHCHVDYAEILDVRDEATGRRVGFVVRMRDGREYEVKVRTGRPTVDTWDDEGWGGKADTDALEPPHEPAPCIHCGAPIDDAGFGHDSGCFYEHADERTYNEAE